MRESELLSRLVIAHEITPDSALLADEYFVAFPEHWRFLREYFSAHATLPNRATFLAQFPDFELVDTGTTAQWLADEVRQDYVECKLRADLNEVTALCELNPSDAVRMMEERLPAYMAHLGGGGFGGHPNLERTGEARVDELAARQVRRGLSGITCGFDLLDAMTNGTQPGEIEIIFGRPGEGKSLVLLYGCFAAIKNGYNVTLISPEMTALEMGVRLDSFARGVSSSAMIAGNYTSAQRHMLKDGAQRQRQVADRENWGSIKLQEPTSIGRRFTTADVAREAMSKPDMIAIDGLMFVEPIKQDRDPRKRIINIMEELKTVVTTTSIPMRLAHQANRESEIVTTKRSKARSISEMLPSLHHMAESDSVGQFANRALAIKRVGTTMYLGLRKNRNNESGRIIAIEVDIDHGVFRSARIVTENEDDGAAQHSHDAPEF